MQVNDMNGVTHFSLGSLMNKSVVSARTADHAPLKILIVDDELIIAVDMAYSLERQGYQIAGLARDGEGAVTLALRTRPDIILLDINLSGTVDGITAAERIRKRMQTTIILASAYPPRNPRIRKFLRSGRSLFIQKPYTMEDIHTLIHHFLPD
jgi:DNA-binding response OmpR family regulator